MKKILPLALVLLFAYNLKAQITFNSLDLNVDDVVLQVVDTNFQTALLSPGTDLYWDFSGVIEHQTNTITPIDPTTTNHASAFTNSNLAFGTIEFAGYAINNTNEYAMLGFGGYIAELDADIEMVYSDADTIIVFPVNYGDSRYSDAYGSTYATVTVPDLGETDVRLSESIFRTQEMDAWGTATTPHDTYEVLRVQEYEIKIDSAFAIIFGFESYQEDYSTFDTTYRYSFYTNDATIKYPLLEVEYDPIADTIIETKWITFMPDNTNKLISTSEQISIYPNPSSDFVNIETKEAIINVNIINTQGKVIKTSSEKTIQISDLPSSIYFIEVKTEHNTFREKLMVK